MQRRILPSRLSGIVWSAALVATVAVTWLFHGDRADFRGIAEDAKQMVSCEAAVEIVSIRVRSGQVVRTGDTLVQARDPQLSMRIAEILHAIEDASGDANINKADSRRRIAQIQADYLSRRAEYEGEIRTLEEQRARNQGLVSGFREMGVVPSDSTGAALHDRIMALRQRMQVEEDGAKSQIALLEGTKGDMARLAGSRNEALGAELSLLRDAQSRLAILSKTEGVVDSVNFRPGENVSPFKPILTISGHRPVLVRGYIPEKLRADLRVGDSVSVLAVGMRAADVRGVVTGLGSRMVELPARLWKVPNYPIWGREVIVGLPSENPLLLGELVEVHRAAPRIGRMVP